MRENALPWPHLDHKMAGSDATISGPLKKIGAKKQDPQVTGKTRHSMLWGKLNKNNRSHKSSQWHICNLVCSGMSRCCHHRHWSQGWHIIGNRACSHWCAQNSWDTSRGKTVAEMVHGFMDVNKHCNNTSQGDVKKSLLSQNASKVSFFFSVC